ncbi:SRPBCC family protein [Pedobacter sp. PWIIR3]
MEKCIKHQWYFNYPPATVWEYLTDSELLAQWLLPTDFKLEVGHKFIFGAKPIKKFSFDGRIYCQVLEFKPQKMLKYSWRGGDGDDVKLNSVVTWTLVPMGTGTELTLVHSGFKGLRNYLPYIVMGRGWLKIAKRLERKMGEQS